MFTYGALPAQVFYRVETYSDRLFMVGDLLSTALAPTTSPPSQDLRLFIVR